MDSIRVAGELLWGSIGDVKERYTQQFWFSRTNSTRQTLRFNEGRLCTSRNRLRLQEGCGNNQNAPKFHQPLTLIREKVLWQFESVTKGLQQSTSIFGFDATMLNLSDQRSERDGNAMVPTKLVHTEAKQHVCLRFRALAVENKLMKSCIDE